MSSTSKSGTALRDVTPTSYGHRNNATGNPCGALTAPLFIGTQHIFSTPFADRYFAAIEPDGRLSKADTPDAANKRAASVRERWEAFQHTNLLPPLRRMIGFVVLDAEGPLKMHQGDDAGVQLMNLLSEIIPGEAAATRHPAGLVGFDIQDAMAIAAFDSAAAGFPPPYWAWNCDHRRQNWFLDPYKYICTSNANREIVPVHDLLARCGWPAEKNIANPLGAAEAARYLAQALGLCS